MTVTGRQLPAAAPGSPIPVAVLGATGAVGQTFVRLLADHPWFVLTEVAASARSAGRPYAEAARWIGGDMPAAVGELEVLPCDPSAIRAPIVFSALDAATARDAESAFAHAGHVVLTNASHHRMDADVPLVVAEVNGSHLALLAEQRRQRGWPGAIVANGNCAAIVVALALAPLHAAFGVRQLFVATMQAVSGAGYPGVPSLDILGNVIPFIGGGEDEKIERETRKILGHLDSSGAVSDAAIAISAQASRVPVEHGHTACMAIAFERPPSADEAMAALRGWRPATMDLALPSAPSSPIVVLEPDDRPPQPRRDADRGGGMSVTVGRVRPDPVLDLRMVACGHNVVRGAAGASILNAELLVAQGALASGAGPRG